MTVTPPPPHWQEALDEAEADVAAGRVVPAEQVHAMLREREYGEPTVRTDTVR